MCGRFTITTDRVEILLKKFGAEPAPGSEAYRPRYNAAPGQPISVVVSKEGRRYLATMLWGFIPPWGEDEGGTMRPQANIRDDTIERNRFFQERLLANRCIVLADGFYEWKKPEGYEHLTRGERLPKGVRKIPYRITMKDGQPFAMAGLWRSVGPAEKKVVTAGIITTHPNGLMAGIHDRMPVILSNDDLALWLEAGVRDFQLLHELLDPYPEAEMEAYIVTTAVNNSRLDDPSCIAPA